MGCIDAIFGNSAAKNQLKGRTDDQQKAILYFLGGTGGCLGTKPCSDAEYDVIVRARLTSVGTKEQALERLGIDIEQVNEIDPVRLEGFNYTKQRIKRGDDNLLRSSGYQVTWLFFSSDQVYAYQYVFALDDDAKNVRTEEYFYRDITNFSTKTNTVEYNKNMGGGCMSQPTTQRSTEDVDVFRLVVPGDSFEASMTQSDYTTKAVRAMQQKLREKKTSI
jgi:hypothetical protein